MAGDGNDVRVELHGNKEARHGTRKGSLSPDGLWEASVTGVVGTRGLSTPHSATFSAIVRPLPLHSEKVVHLHGPGRGAVGVVVAP